MSESKRKSTVVLIVVLAVLIVAAIVTSVWILHNREVKKAEAEAAEQADAEQKELFEHQCDSLYNNFTTPDLKMFSLKGFVKEADFLDFTATFDREGNFKTWVVLSGGPIEFARDDSGRVISAKGQTVTCYGTGDPNLSEQIRTNVTYKFEYDNDGYLVGYSRVTDDPNEGSVHYSFQNPNEYHFYNNRIEHHDNCEGLWTWSVKLYDFTTDDFGNWTGYTELIDGGVPTSYTRKIEYLPKENVNFKKLLGNEIKK